MHLLNLRNRIISNKIRAIHSKTQDNPGGAGGRTVASSSSLRDTGGFGGQISNPGADTLVGGLGHHITCDPVCTVVGVNTSKALVEIQTNSQLTFPFFVFVVVRIINDNSS
jgi:hypothetical protein